MLRLSCRTEEKLKGGGAVFEAENEGCFGRGELKRKLSNKRRYLKFKAFVKEIREMKELR